MTGYGSGECSRNGFKITVELSSVNRKQGEISVILPRELEVLRHISQGETSREAARAMRISPASVRMHVDNIFQKLESGSRPAATLKALARGLI